MKNIFKFCNVAFGMCNRFSLTVSPQKLLKWLKEREVNNEDIESAKNATVMSIPVEKIMAIRWTVMRLKIDKMVVMAGFDWKFTILFVIVTTNKM